MSTNVYLDHHGYSYSHQFTANYCPILAEAGLPPWRALQGVKAKHALWVLDWVNNALATKRPDLETLLRGGGTWGTYDDLQVQMIALRNFAYVHPKAKFTVV